MDEAAKELKVIQTVNKALGTLSGPSIRRVMTFVNDVQSMRVVAYEKEMTKSEAEAAPAQNQETQS